MTDTDQREVLEVLYERCFGVDLAFDKREGDLTRYRQFTTMLGINTPESLLGAVMMMVPKDHKVMLSIEEDGRAACWLWNKFDDPPWFFLDQPPEGRERMWGVLHDSAASALYAAIRAAKDAAP